MKYTFFPVYAAAQISAVPGNIKPNIETHLMAMKIVANEGVDVLVFSELSVTGYELNLGKLLQAEISDPIFPPLQVYARKHNMLVILGMPL